MTLVSLLFLMNCFLICICAYTIERATEIDYLREGSPCFFDDGSEGVCRRNCVGPADLRREFHICDLTELGIVDCCRTSSVNSQIAEKYPTLVKACKERRDDLTRVRRDLEKMKWELGNPVAQVAFGTFVASGEFPHASALGWRTPSEGETEWNCGGSLIHPEYVLTAAHCLANFQTPPSTIRISARNLVGSNTPEGRNFTIEKVYLHPKYNSDFYYNDIALLKLSERYEGPVACVWLKREIPQELTAIGYGAPDFGQMQTNVLLKVNLSVVDSEECSKHYVGDTSLPNGIIDSQICAEDPEGKMDTCEGDSGGPLQFGDNFIVGITSFGKQCSSGYPGVYTRISSYLGWIEGVINPF